MNASDNNIVESVCESVTRYPDFLDSHHLVIDQEQIKRMTKKAKNEMDLSKTDKNSMFKKQSQQIQKVQSRYENARTSIMAPDQKQIKMYEENLQLKKKQQEMKRQMQQLRTRLEEKNQVFRTQNQNQLKLLAAGKKNVWDKRPGSQPKGRGTPNNLEQTKISNLLQIIDSYKAKYATAEEQIANLKRQKYLLEQDGRLKQKKNDQIMRDFKGQNDSSNRFELEQQLRNVTRLLEIEKQRNKFNEADIKRMETKILVLQTKQTQIEDLKSINRNLQQKIIRMSNLPSFSNVTDKVEQQRKFKQMEQKYKSISEKYAEVSKQNIKTQAQHKALQARLIQQASKNEKLERENLQMRQFTLQNPVLKKLIADPDLLMEVTYYINEGKRDKSAKVQSERQSYDKLIFEKEMLANELTTLRTKMTALQQNWKQKQRMSKIQREEMLAAYKEQLTSNNTGAGEQKTMSKNGVPYTEDVSMFTQNEVKLGMNTNYFDLFLGDMHLLESMLATSFGIRNVESSLILATVDFYNHPTETTRPIHGAHSNLQSEFSFKVTQDEFFFKYLNKSSFTVEIWVSQGNKRINVGKSTIQLKPLVYKSRKNLAPVVSSSAPVYINQKVMGSINFVMRMRLPIHDQIQKVNQLDQIVSSEQAPIRKLVIQIQQGKNFPASSNTFVYFPFRLEDYYTKTFKGSNPLWNYYKTIELSYNTDVKNYLRKNQLQLVVIDDNAVITGQGDSDVLGEAYISLIPVLENKIIKQRVTVYKGTQKIGTIDVKIFWLEQEALQKSEHLSGLRSAQGLVEDIRAYVKSKNIDLEALFNKIDINNTNMLSFQQFLNWVLSFSKSSYDTVNQFYKQFRQPLNAVNFVSRLTSCLNPAEHTKQIAKGLSEINKMLEINSLQIKMNKVTLEQFLKDKDITQVSLDIDKSYDGKISRKELIDYFQQHNVEIPEQLLTLSGKQQIQLVAFIKKYQNFS